MAYNTAFRPRTRAIAPLLIAVTVSATILTGCSAGGDGGDDKADLRILANITPALTKEYYEALVQPWLDEHEGVTVTIEVPTENVQTSLQQELASGDVPDIVASNLDTVVVPQLLPFPDEEWVNDTPLSDQNKADGAIWQVATGAQVQSLVYYNKDAFAAAGIDAPPTTLEEFTDDLKALKSAGYLPLQTAGEWVTGAQFAFFATPQLLNDGNFWAERTAGDQKFVGSSYEKYLDAYASWVADGLVASDALGVKYDDTMPAFNSGDVGMFIMGNWVVPTLADGASFDVGVFAPPSLNGDPLVVASGAAQPYSILKDSKHTDLALDLVEFLVTDPDAVSTALAAEGNFRPGFSYEGSDLNNAVAAILDDAPGLVLGTAGPDLPAGFGDELNKDVQTLYTGASGKDVAAALDAWWDLNANQ